ncbi:putative hydrolase of the HAD superfamily [Actinomycetospora succinea]|uniref:Putative hydrolase of the HAD superfamily n=1 Tax=Actinomycetospora succinea TaxID=663603 RepID=A0A4V3DAS4_9PSEU|nr:HAD family hydrolase [Actinomycetospora succinea]TDQ63263.1 putative hydrolase of the HAD superfamily [Actinomycetospora succinea]
MRALFDLPAAYRPSVEDRAAPVPPIEAVLCDFSNTLFRMVPTDEWLRRIADDTGRSLDDPEAVLAALDAAAAEPEVIAAQEGRDLDAGAHRRAMLAWFSRVDYLRGIEDAAQARVVAEDSWVPYPDTGPFLATLADRGVPVGVVSDIGWDIRDHARAAGLADLVGTWVLSCEEGCEKPAPELFRTACARLDVDPRRTLMVGDNPRRDGGATAAGLRAFLLAGEQRERERGLADVLALLSPPA